MLTRPSVVIRYDGPLAVPLQQHDVHDGGPGEHGRPPPLHGPPRQSQIFRKGLKQQQM
jgi:hypothetical protein